MQIILQTTWLSSSSSIINANYTQVTKNNFVTHLKKSIMFFKRAFNRLRVKAFHKNPLQKKHKKESYITTQVPDIYRKISKGFES